MNEIEQPPSPQRPPSGIRHQIANELAVIVGFTELLLEEAGAGHAWRSDLEAIRLAAQRATALLAESRSAGA